MAETAGLSLQNQKTFIFPATFYPFQLSKHMEEKVKYRVNWDDVLTEKGS
jgi:hypothetical protein